MGFHDSVELVRRSTDALNRGDYDAAVRDWADDAVVDWSRSHGLDAGAFRGKDEIRAFMKRFREGFNEVHIEIVGSPVENGDGVFVVENIARVVGRDGIEATARSAWLITISDGRQTSLTLYQTKTDALTAARV
jgi:ketosteroid isomerase-like protein